MYWSVYDIVRYIDSFSIKYSDASRVGVMKTASCNVGRSGRSYRSCAEPGQSKSRIVSFCETFLTGPQKLHVRKPSPA